ncbi:hypothetical protein L1887_19438 [Cichorium endivia]|nr:hypothetical protein L1887_19438 [Cichorium endivia]
MSSIRRERTSSSLNDWEGKTGVKEKIMGEGGVAIMTPFFFLKALHCGFMNRWTPPASAIDLCLKSMKAVVLGELHQLLPQTSA